MGRERTVTSKATARTSNQALQRGRTMVYISVLLHAQASHCRPAGLALRCGESAAGAGGVARGRQSAHFINIPGPPGATGGGGLRGTRVPGLAPESATCK